MWLPSALITAYIQAGIVSRSSLSNSGGTVCHAASINALSQLLDRLAFTPDLFSIQSFIQHQMVSIGLRSGLKAGHSMTLSSIPLSSI
jgi:hypothetical protein